MPDMRQRIGEILLSNLQKKCGFGLVEIALVMMFSRL